MLLIIDYEDCLRGLCLYFVQIASTLISVEQPTHKIMDSGERTILA